MEKFKAVKWNSTVNSIIFLLLGLLLLLFPIESLNIGGYLIASILLLLGGGYLIRIIQNKGIETNGDIIYIVISIAFIVLSITIFLDPTWVIRMINIIVGIFLIISSLMNLLSLLKYTKDRTRSWWVFLSLVILIILLGIVVIVDPLFLANILIRLEGATLIINSIITILLTRKVNTSLVVVNKENNLQ